jgi:hypothetical protein
MSTTEVEEYMTRAEDCIRLAGACIAESNQQILIYAAVHWRMLAEVTASKSVERPKSNESTPRAIAQELETRGADAGRPIDMAARAGVDAAGRLKGGSRHAKSSGPIIGSPNQLRVPRARIGSSQFGASGAESLA